MDKTLYSVSMNASTGGFRIGHPVLLFRLPVFSAPWDCISFDVSRNGDRILVNMASSSSKEELVYRQNW